jgi:hypothetical protein
MQQVETIDGESIVDDVVTLGIASTGLYTGRNSPEYFIEVDPNNHTAIYNGIFNSPNNTNNHI